MNGNITINHAILAVVTINPEFVTSGNVPVFYVKSDKELERISLYLSRILDGMAHSLDNGTNFIVKHDA